MTADLILGFPHQRKCQAVLFDETVQVHIFECPKVSRHELWYTKAEYHLMKLDIRDDVLTFRATSVAMKSRGVVEDDSSTEESVCIMGIEHLLTPARVKEVEACRIRCIQAVLKEQARAKARSPPASTAGVLEWENIAFASIARTRKATLRARKLGKLHQAQETIICQTS